MSGGESKGVDSEAEDAMQPLVGVGGGFDLSVQGLKASTTDWPVRMNLTGQESAQFKPIDF